MITGVEWLHADFDSIDIEPEGVILFKLLTAFGPLPDALLSHVNDEQGVALLKGLWQGIQDDGLYEPLKDWPKEYFPNLDLEAKRFILRMTNLDPSQRPSMSEVMKDPYWEHS